MIGLYLLAAHLVGDLLLQNRWMARKKLDDGWWRTYHVTVYCVPFIPVVLLYTGGWRAGLFFAGLFVMHWATDARKFRSSLGDWLHWQLFMDAEARRREWLLPGYFNVGSERSIPPNVWPLLGSAVDQTLHIAQIALLGGLFL